jgi:hypothetical protein
MRPVLLSILVIQALALQTTPLFAQDSSGGSLPRSPTPPVAVQVSDDAIRAHYLAHPHDYDEYELSHIFIAVAGRSRTVPTTRTLAQACVLAADITSKLKMGARFEDLAGAYSDDEASRSEGGQLSSMFRRYMMPVIEHNIGNLKAGDVSAPILGPEGIHIVKVNAIHYASFERAKGLIGVELRGQGAGIRPLAPEELGSGSLPADCLSPKA